MIWLYGLVRYKFCVCRRLPREGETHGATRRSIDTLVCLFNAAFWQEAMKTRFEDAFKAIQDARGRGMKVPWRSDIGAISVFSIRFA